MKAPHVRPVRRMGGAARSSSCAPTMLRLYSHSPRFKRYAERNVGGPVRRAAQCNSLDFHEAVGHALSDDTAGDACQAVFAEFDHQAEEALPNCVGRLAGCVGLEYGFGRACNPFLEACTKSERRMGR